MLETRSEDKLQALVDDAPLATAYYSDSFATYANLVYGEATYTALLDKSQTYTVEGGNADLRHYLARLAWPVPLFFALYCGVTAGGEVVCLVLQPTPALAAALPRVSETPHRFCITIPLATPAYKNPEMI